MVRSHLEYTQTVWSPHKQCTIEVLEKVQKRATRLLPSLRNLPYDQRLIKLDLPTLSYRRVRGDMIETYKILKGMFDISACPQPAPCRKTRGHNLKLYIKQSSHTNMRKKNFCQNCKHLEFSTSACGRVY